MFKLELYVLYNACVDILQVLNHIFFFTFTDYPVSLNLI